MMLPLAPAKRTSWIRMPPEVCVRWRAIRRPESGIQRTANEPNRLNGSGLGGATMAADGYCDCGLILNSGRRMARPSDANFRRHPDPDVRLRAPRATS